MSISELSDLPSAHDAGRICAVARQVQRDLQRCAQRYGELFPPPVFDPALFSAVALANTFASPWLGAAQSRAANRAALWTFALDRLVEGALVDDVVTTCLAAVDGGGAPDPLSAFLVEIRDELSGGPAYPSLAGVWRSELERLLSAMARERDWITAGTRPDVRTYLDNADNLAFAFVFATHLVAVSTTPAPAAVDELFVAARTAQRALRIVNDLATHERDERTGDLNVLMLGATRDEAGRWVSDLVDRTRQLLAPLAALQPHLCVHLERQLSYNLSFYGVSDYWSP